jgi:hypothetical protein
MRTAAPSGPGSAQEGGLVPEATAPSIPFTLPISSATLPAAEMPHQQEVASPTPPAVEAFTLEETALNSAKGTSDMGT